MKFITLRKKMLLRNRKDFNNYLADILDISPAAASKKFKGESKFNLDDVKKISEELDLSVDDVQKIFIEGVE